jgi:predicted transcriptional regulator
VPVSRLQGELAQHKQRQTAVLTRLLKQAQHLQKIMTQHINLFCMLQKSKSTRRKKEQEAREVLPKLTEDEKGDIVNQAVEALQDAIQKVCRHTNTTLAGQHSCAGAEVLRLHWHAAVMRSSSRCAERQTCPRPVVSCRPR